MAQGERLGANRILVAFESHVFTVDGPAEFNDGGNTAIHQQNGCQFRHVPHVLQNKIAAGEGEVQGYGLQILAGAEIGGKLAYEGDLYIGEGCGWLDA